MLRPMAWPDRPELLQGGPPFGRFGQLDGEINNYNMQALLSFPSIRACVVNHKPNADGIELFSHIIG